MSSEVREFKINGSALVTRKQRSRKMKGGDNSGALMQVAGQDVATNMVAPTPQNVSTQYSSSVKSALDSNFGPAKIQQFGGKKQNGGDSTGATVNLASTRSTPGVSYTPVTSGVSPSQPAAVGGAVIASAGGLVLAPPKRKTRISLKPKKGGSTSMNIGDVPPVAGGSGSGSGSGSGRTRKARKIHIRVKGVTARLARAKKAKKEAMSAPISLVKGKLESAGVIKKSSKAPEPMLRTMYADLLITKKGL
jgi:hypothetical protein